MKFHLFKSGCNVHYPHGLDRMRKYNPGAINKAAALRQVSGSRGRYLRFAASARLVPGA